MSPVLKAAGLLPLVAFPGSAAAGDALKATADALLLFVSALLGILLACAVLWARTEARRIAARRWRTPLEPVLSDQYRRERKRFLAGRGAVLVGYLAFAGFSHCLSSAGDGIPNALGLILLMIATATALEMLLPGNDRVGTELLECLAKQLDAVSALPEGLAIRRESAALLQAQGDLYRSQYESLTHRIDGIIARQRKNEVLGQLSAMTPSGGAQR